LPLSVATSSQVVTVVVVYGWMVSLETNQKNEVLSKASVDYLVHAVYYF